MKKAIPFILTASVFIFSSFNSQSRYDAPRAITLAGKIDNYDPGREVCITIHKPGLSSEEVHPKTDSAGNFTAIFESYTPVDTWVLYKTNFRVLLHPGDSLFVRFDGKYGDRPELLGSVSFGGDRAKTNQYAAKYQQMYFSDETYYDWGKRERAVKEYDAGQYLQYLDSVQQKKRKIYDRFVAENDPDQESRKWAQLSIDEDYYYNVAWYASSHRRANNMDWSDSLYLPAGFYEVLLDQLPIDPSMFINSSSLSSLPNRLLYTYISSKLKGRETPVKNEETGEEYYTWQIAPSGGLMGDSRTVDSLRVFGTFEFIPDPLARQMVLAHFFSQQFERQDITVYERFRHIADTAMTAPFIREPLEQKYLQTKYRIENPQLYTEAILKESAGLSVNQVMEDILQANKGKVVYVDLWGTWCGPCLAEMPNSKVVEHELRDKDVVFVYVCLESEEARWKAALDKFQLGGQHYFLSYGQSGEIRNLLSVTGVPFYLLIDKNGAIVEKGNHLRPLTAKDKIVELLK